MATEATVLTERTLGGLKVEPVVESASFLNMLIYGDPGVGKTVLAGSAQACPDLAPVVFIDMEGGTLSLRKQYPNVEVVPVKSMDHMQRVYEELRRGNSGYKTVVLDSLTEIQKFSMYGIMDQVVKDNEDRDPDVPGLKEWAKNTEQIRKLVRAFRDLPMNTIFTALSAHDFEPSRTRPSLSAKLSSEVAGFVDIVVYMYIKIVGKERKRLLLSQGTGITIAKDRSGFLPEVIEHPTMADIYAYVYNNQTG